MTRFPFVLGLGNPLRGDDGAGPRAIRLLAARGLAGRARLVHELQAVPELAEEVAEASRLIVIDVRTDLPAGQIHERPLLPGEGSPRSALSHGVSSDALLSLADSLYGVDVPGFAVTVGGSSFGPGSGLSLEVEEAIPELCDRVEALVDAGAAPRGPLRPADPFRDSERRLGRPAEERAWRGRTIA